MHKVDFDTMVMDGSGKPQHAGTNHPGDIFRLFLVCRIPFLNFLVSMLSHIDAKWKI
jgi:hypothetical protein